MRNQLFLLGQAVVASVLLSGCGQSKLDARQLDWTNGLAYQHGVTTPFTGMVEWTDQIPDNLAQYWKNAMPIDLVAVASTCESQFTNGVIDGLTTCSTAKGQKILELTFAKEQYEGESRLWNGDGKLVRKFHWIAGKLDGVAEIYTNDGKQKIIQTTWKNGVQDGPYKSWAADGTALSDAEYHNGNPFSGKIVDAKGAIEYKAGLLNGPATWIGHDGQTVISKGSYSAGNRVGPWEDWQGNIFSDGNYFIIYKWNGPGGLFTEQAMNQLPSDFNGATDKGCYVKTNWTADGKLDGDVQVFDKGNNLILSFHVKNNMLDGPFKYLSPQYGMRSYTFTDGKLVAAPPGGNAAQATPPAAAQ